MKSALREALWFHGLFLAIALALLFTVHGERYGQALTALALAYNILLPLYAVARGHAEWLSLWFFLIPLSCAQVFPDWALVDIGHALSFPDHGQYRIGGAVPVYFMGLWIMLLFPILLICDTTRRRYFNTAVLSLLLFAFWEWAARPLALWHASNVFMIAGTAVYPIIPEMILCVAALQAYRNSHNRNIIQRVFSAFGVNLLYTGAVFIGLLLCRHLL
ncbi:MAG TPA: hypothetical protein VN046_06790 [Stenotrophobium sp.]|jgi:hypothetical protein|nr:hypothetical protein [Stenotrophobium sp.]